MPLVIGSSYPTELRRGSTSLWETLMQRLAPGLVLEQSEFYGPSFCGPIERIELLAPKRSGFLLRHKSVAPVRLTLAWLAVRPRRSSEWSYLQPSDCPEYAFRRHPVVGWHARMDAFDDGSLLIEFLGNSIHIPPATGTFNLADIRNLPPALLAAAGSPTASTRSRPFFMPSGRAADPPLSPAARRGGAGPPRSSECAASRRPPSRGRRSYGRDGLGAARAANDPGRCRSPRR